MTDALAAFLDGTTPPERFGHAEHVAMAKRLLAGHSFLEAALIYDHALAKITARAGVPQKRSLTKTLAFLSLSAEHGDAPSGQALETWYSPDRLADPRGGDIFLMPDRVAAR